MSIQKGLRPGDRVWVRVPTKMIERRFGTIKSVKGESYSVEWDIDTREGHGEYSTQEIVTVHYRPGRQNGADLHE